jgi:membrane protein
MVTNDSPGSPDRPASETGKAPRNGRAGIKADQPPRAGRARRVTEWGKQRYTGSSAEYLYGRLNTLDFINQGMLFAATLLLCALPFLIVVTALSGRSAATGIGRRLGLNGSAAGHFNHLFAPPTATSSAVIGTTSMVFFVLGGIAVASSLQALYERVFDVGPLGWKGMFRQLIWLAVVLGGAFLFASYWGPAVRHAGLAVFVIAALAWFIGFWWLTMWLLLAGRVSWRRLFPCALATGVFWLGMEIVFRVIMSGMVVSEDKEYGPIGIIFAIMSYLIAIGVVIILGAVVGLVWQERGLSFTGAFRKLRRAR